MSANLVTIIVELVLIMPVAIYFFYSMSKKIRLCKGKTCPQCQTTLKPFQPPFTRNWEQWRVSLSQMPLPDRS